MTDSLTEEQVAECKEVFALFDKQGVGQVPTESLGRLLRALGYNPSNREVQEMINQVASESGDVIDFTTFSDLVGKRLSAVSTSEDTLEEAFRALDRQLTGRLKAADLRVLLTNMGECLTEEEVEEMMQEAQVGPKGEFDYREFTRLVLSK
ncbi:hypothetical protein BOX15_Mlig008509g2 [Macrostomum lignano]|uniref:EF-hand domain-containing protein n=1 Tax=Macrostomum lignano TaxID=282301 RepID=A0A267GNK0_9PLAT|nr:hypothetical protein BOX15_Mlig008509g3 [Macrostomum lignano]PAA86869.1 hypothetical protein BOX15_Mlig008509g2 [Macrostomum lignano]